LKVETKNENGRPTDKAKTSEGDPAVTADRHPGLNERLKNLETHLAMRYGKFCPLCYCGQSDGVCGSAVTTRITPSSHQVCRRSYRSTRARTSSMGCLTFQSASSWGEFHSITFPVDPLSEVSLLFASGLHHHARRRSSSPPTLHPNLLPTRHLLRPALSKVQCRLHPLPIRGRPSPKLKPRAVHRGQVCIVQYWRN
jgi:hypothetical protein